MREELGFSQSLISSCVWDVWDFWNWIGVSQRKEQLERITVFSRKASECWSCCLCMSVSFWKRRDAFRSIQNFKTKIEKCVSRFFLALPSFCLLAFLVVFVELKIAKRTMLFVLYGSMYYGTKYIPHGQLQFNTRVFKISIRLGVEIVYLVNSQHQSSTSVTLIVMHTWPSSQDL